MSDTLTITRDWFAMLESLPDASFRRVLSAVASFAFDGTKPEGLGGLEIAVFMTIKPVIQNRKRVARFNTNKPKPSLDSALDSNGSDSKLKPLDSALDSNGDGFLFNIVDSHGNLKKDNTLDSSRDIKENRVKESPKQKRKIFVPPTLEEVREYAFERNSPADPEEFYSYHSASGWMIGRAKMVDWKKAFVYWERKEFNRARRRNSPPPRDYSGI